MAGPVKQGRKRWLGSLALALGTLGAGLLLKRRAPGRRRMSKEQTDSYQRNTEGDRWARPGMLVTFRAEIMPSRDRAARTFRITKLLPSGRVLLEGVAGEHTASEFELRR
ncbi:MAG TPA: hypothetical protein VE775_03045 [Pyrinomonadaceae bacterium]|nr:hypothetical protein [Pyrinomonadaceae bacterium]